MRNGALQLVEAATPIVNRSDPDRSLLKITVQDHDGRFEVFCTVRITERWASDPVVEFRWVDMFQEIGAAMLRLADHRRHEGIYSMDQPMIISQGDLES